MEGLSISMSRSSTFLSVPAALGVNNERCLHVLNVSMIHSLMVVPPKLH